MRPDQVSDLIVAVLCTVFLIYVLIIWLRNRKKVYRKDDSIEVGGSGLGGEPAQDRPQRAAADPGPDSGDVGGGGDGGGGD